MTDPFDNARQFPSFTEGLRPTLSLDIAGTTFDIVTGDIDAFELEMTPWGFRGHASFWQQDNKAAGGQEEDKLLEPFLKPDLIKATFKVSSDYLRRSVKSPPDPISVIGLVQRKAVVEQEGKGVKNRPILHRLYTIEFADAAHVLWRQHWPSQLYVDKTFKDALEEHKGAEILLKHELTALTVRHPVLCLGQGVFEPPASFYDLVIWFLNRWNGHLLYDPTTRTYTLGKEKKAAGSAIYLDPDDVAGWQMRLPEQPRWEGHILNASTLDSRNEPLTQDQSVKGVRRDLLLRSDVASRINDRKTEESNRQAATPQPEVRLWFRQMPSIAVTPGALLKMDGTPWSTKLQFKGKQYRAFRLHIRAEATRRDADLGHAAPQAEFETHLVVDVETKEDARPRLPAFQTPRYPIEVEGKVVSEKLEEKELSWHLYENQDTSEEQYRVEIPLWENQQVVAPFLPSLAAGHFYFPAYKGERVLVALHFTAAEIRRFLDWRPGARLTQDSQGNHLFMGLTETDRTSFQHVYEDQKPVFQLHRRHEKDVGSVRIEEGTMILRIEEEKG